MGDIADYLVDRAMDDGYSLFRRAPSPITCTDCGKRNLFWRAQPTGGAPHWTLFEGKKRHRCDQPRVSTKEADCFDNLDLADLDVVPATAKPTNILFEQSIRPHETEHQFLDRLRMFPDAHNGRWPDKLIVSYARKEAMLSELAQADDVPALKRIIERLITGE